MTTYEPISPDIDDEGVPYWIEFCEDSRPAISGGVYITIERLSQTRSDYPDAPIALRVTDCEDSPYTGIAGLSVEQARSLARMLLSAAAHAAGTPDESPEAEAPVAEAPVGEPEADTTPDVLPVVADDGHLPVRAHPSDAGLDLMAAKLVAIAPGDRARVPTGVQVAIPEGHVGYITPRSGIAARYGLTVLNAPGTIDAGYRGEIEVLLVNHENREVWVERGARIAQLVIHPIITPEVKLVDALPVTERGEGGFGSTGA